MDWEYLDRELRKVYHEDTISPDDQKTFQLLEVILIKRYPYLKHEGIQKAMQLAFDSMYEPYWVDDFLPRLAEKMYEVPYKMLVSKTKKPKS